MSDAPHFFFRLLHGSFVPSHLPVPAWRLHYTVVPLLSFSFTAVRLPVFGSDLTIVATNAAAVHTTLLDKTRQRATTPPTQPFRPTGADNCCLLPTLARCMTGTRRARPSSLQGFLGTLGSSAQFKPLSRAVSHLPLLHALYSLCFSPACSAADITFNPHIPLNLHIPFQSPESLLFPFLELLETLMSHF